MRDTTHPERLGPQPEGLLVRAEAARLRLLRGEQVALAEDDVPERVQVLEALPPQLRRRPRAAWQPARDLIAAR